MAIPKSNARSAMTPGPRSVVIGTAGHIDHGKTALVHALTGVDTDRLPEEKRRGITVDLGFASLRAEGPDKTPLLISFIDVPGHALFVRNMLAGTGGIDAVMLVVSAEEGVKPQTEEHLAICDMLGITVGLTVISKIDSVSDERLSIVRKSVEQFLSNTFLSIDRSPILPVSAYSGAGMELLHQELSLFANRVRDKDAEAVTRLPLDRAFVMRGFGTVVTGTLIAGSLKAGQAVSIEPGARNIRIRGLQVHGHTKEMASAGSRVAVNLSGLEATELHRGDTLVEASTILAVNVVDAELTLLPHAPPLKHRSRVHVHAFTSDCIAAVSLYGYEPVEPGSTRLARLRFNKPVVVLPGDRFVIRQSSPPMTIGGGRILDARPMQRLRKATNRAWLQKLKDAPRDRQLELRIERRGTAGIPIGDLLVETGMRLESLREWLAPLIRNGSVQQAAGDLLISRQALEVATALISRVLELRENVGGGLKRSELRSQTRISTEVLDLVVQTLVDQQVLRVQGELVFPFQRSAETGSDHSRMSAIERAYQAAGLTAPSTEEVAARLSIDSAEMRRLTTLLLREKKLVRLGSDSLCVHHQALADLRSRIQELRGQTVDIARFKILTGLSRKYAIPLLEHFDRERVTRKQGEHRIVL